MCVCIHTHTYTHTYTHSEILLSLKKNETMPSTATWMNLEIITVNEVSQTKKDECYVIPLICGI